MKENPTSTRIRALLEAMEQGLYERTDAVRLAFLAALAGESIFFLGPPGVAKSLIARRIKHAFRDARSFEYLMGRFSTPEEIFGPISLKQLKEHDSYRRITTHYLPDADVVFLDEIWKASPPIQNALLTALNERLFRNGTDEVALPLKLVVAASNEVPELHTDQAAFWDRFLVRVIFAPVAGDASFAQLVRDKSAPFEDPIADDLKITDDEYNRWSAAVMAIAIPDSVVEFLWSVATAARQSPDLPTVSDRRWKKIAHLLRCSGFLHGRDSISVLDCELITSALWNTEEQVDGAFALVRDALRRFDHGFRGRLLALESDLEALKKELAEDTIVERVEEVEAPRFYRGEYYRLLDYPFDGAVLIWHGDLEEILVHERRRCDLFFYDGGDHYVRTESVEMMRSGLSVTINGAAYEVETERQSQRVVESAPTAPETHAAHRRRAEELIRGAQVLVREIAAHTNSLKDQAGEHLFLSSKGQVAVLDGLDRTADRAGEVELAARRYLLTEATERA